MKATRISLCAAILAIGSMALASCTSGLNTQDAYRACQTLQKSSPTFGSFNECVACFEKCDDCQPVGTSPTVYACPGQTPSTTTSSSGATSTGTGG